MALVVVEIMDGISIDNAPECGIFRRLQDLFFGKHRGGEQNSGHCGQGKFQHGLFSSYRVSLRLPICKASRGGRPGALTAAGAIVRLPLCRQTGRCRVRASDGDAHIGCFPEALIHGLAAG